MNIDVSIGLSRHCRYVCQDCVVPQRSSPIDNIVNTYEYRDSKTWKNRIKSAHVVAKYYHGINGSWKRAGQRRVTSQRLFIYFLSFFTLLIRHVTQVCGRQSMAGNRTTFYAKNVPIRGSRKKRRSARTVQHTFPRLELHDRFLEMGYTSGELFNSFGSIGSHTLFSNCARFSSLF